MNVPKLDAQDLRTVQRLYKAEDLDFRLKPGSAAIDRGMGRRISPTDSAGGAGSRRA